MALEATCHLFVVGCYCLLNAKVQRSKIGTKGTVSLAPPAAAAPVVLVCVCCAYTKKGMATVLALGATYMHWHDI